jgi:hypothetical protein
VLQTEATYKVEIISTVEYLNTKYKEDQFVDIAKEHEKNQPNRNSTIKISANFAQESDQTSARKGSINIQKQD